MKIFYRYTLIAFTLCGLSNIVFSDGRQAAFTVRELTDVSRAASGYVVNDKEDPKVTINNISLADINNHYQGVQHFCGAPSYFCAIQANRLVGFTTPYDNASGNSTLQNGKIYFANIPKEDCAGIAHSLIRYSSGSCIPTSSNAATFVIAAGFFYS